MRRSFIILILIGGTLWLEIFPGVVTRVASSQPGARDGEQKLWWSHWAPSLHYTLAFAYKRGKITEKPVRVAEKYLAKQWWARFVQSTWQPFYGYLLTFITISLRFTWLGSILGQHKYLAVFRTRGLPTSANFKSKLSVRALIRSAKNGTPKSSQICQLPMYQGALIAMQRH